MNLNPALLVERDLLNRHFLKANNVTKKQMQDYLSGHVLEEGFRSFEPDKQIRCDDLLLALFPLLKRISEEPEEGWIRYILDGTLSQLFPEGKEFQESRERKLARNIIFQFYFEASKFQL